MTAQRTDDNVFAIIHACLAGDEDAYVDFFNAYKDSVYRTCLLITGSRADAEDATQVTFIKLFRSLDTYDSARSVRAWVHRIATNSCLDIIRRRRRQMGLVERARAFVEEMAPIHPPSFDNELASMVVRLPLKPRVVVVLRYLLDMSQEEIASALNIPVGTVKSRLGQGLGQLRGMYGAVGADRVCGGVNGRGYSV